MSTISAKPSNFCGSTFLKSPSDSLPSYTRSTPEPSLSEPTRRS